MCGLCGVAGHYLTTTEADGVKTLLRMSAERGPDSTGVFYVHDPEHHHENGKKTISMPAFYEKEALSSFQFIEKRKNTYPNTFSVMKSRIIAGHCRSATIGKVSDENAHPFAFNNLVGMHNGTIQFTSDLEHMNEYETDSEALFRNLNDHGLQETIDRIGFRGAYSLVWFDKRQLTLNFFRNDQRPLFLMYTNNGNVLWWASEPWMLNGLAERKNLNKGELGVWQLKPLIHFAVPMYKTRDLFSRENVIIREMKIHAKQKAPKNFKWAQNDWEQNVFGGKYKSEIPVIESTTTVSEGEDGIPFDDTVPQTQTSGSTNTANSTSSVAKTQNGTLFLSDKTKGSPTPFKGFEGKYISKEHFERVLHAGCAICLESQDASQYDIQYKVGWAAPDKIICSSCMSKSEWVVSCLVRNVNAKVSNHVG